MPRSACWKKPDVIAIGAGERTGLVAEELAFHEVGRDRGAIDGDHRPIGPRAGAVDGPRDELLAGAAFAAHQHAARRAGDAVDFRFQIAHRRAVADQLVVAGRLFDQPLVVAAQRHQRAGPHERDRHDVGHGDDEVEIGLAEAAVFEIDVDRAERRSFAIVVAAHERRANGVGKVAQVLRALLRRLVGDPDGVALPRDELGERLIERDAIGRVARDDELRLQAAFVVDREEADDGCVGPLAQQVERDFHHAVRIAAAQAA